ncbi:ATP-binding protein [Sphingomonas sp. KR1UV-12]|uniref:histidine kinase n=1 Tax=Sphingomonas aurea TaxID=3063994 RepID=A0ABT9EIY9_9SPHN|nr:ATP-binding protein [Sphingomonas sp. KR1UV-12]MDP1026776.1 ATP-binding protein [Sphingomonas sp. KR1UV-12]
MASLRRLTVVFLSAFGVATATTGYATFYASRQAIVQLVDRRIATTSSALLSEAPAGDATAILARIDAFSRRRESGDIGFELRDAAGRRLGGNVTVTRALPAGFSTLRISDRIAGLSAGRVQVRDAGRGLRLVTAIETEPIDGLASARRRYALTGFGVIALIVVAGTVAFSILVRRRIQEVRATAEAIIDGDLARRVPVEGGGVFAEQAATFNRMLDRIAALVEGIRNVGGDVAHDLRTPLARLRSRLARIVASAPDAATEQELEAALAQCDEIMAIFAAILRIAEIESGDRAVAFVPVDLTAVAQDVTETMATVAEESGHHLEIHAAMPAVVDGDRQLIAQAAFNLVENALRHTPPGSTVRLSVTEVDGTALLEVSDDGPGIAPADRNTARRRFGRLDASRNRDGHGLGLTLVDAVARFHRGTLDLGDAAPGLVATLRFPQR